MAETGFRPCRSPIKTGGALASSGVINREPEKSRRDRLRRLGSGGRRSETPDEVEGQTILDNAVVFGSQRDLVGDTQIHTLGDP